MFVRRKKSRTELSNRAYFHGQAGHILKRDRNMIVKLCIHVIVQFLEIRMRKFDSYTLLWGVSLIIGMKKYFGLRKILFL